MKGRVRGRMRGREGGEPREGWAYVRMSSEREGNVIGC